MPFPHCGQNRNLQNKKVYRTKLLILLILQADIRFPLNDLLYYRLFNTINYILHIII